METQKQDLKTFFLALDLEARVRFAATAGTTVDYMHAHLIQGSRVPRPALMDGLANACREFGAGLSKEDLLAFFYNRAQAGQGVQTAALPQTSV